MNREKCVLGKERFKVGDYLCVSGVGVGGGRRCIIELIRDVGVLAVLGEGGEVYFRYKWWGFGWAELGDIADMV